MYIRVLDHCSTHEISFVHIVLTVSDFLSPGNNQSGNLTITQFCNIEVI